MKTIRELLLATTVEDPTPPHTLWIVSTKDTVKEDIEQLGRYLESKGGVPFKYGGRSLWAFSYSSRAWMAVAAGKDGVP